MFLGWHVGGLCDDGRNPYAALTDEATADACEDAGQSYYASMAAGVPGMSAQLSLVKSWSMSK